jgi:hypothetical protein
MTNTAIETFMPTYKQTDTGINMRKHIDTLINIIIMIIATAIIIIHHRDVGIYNYSDTIPRN